MLRLGLSNYVPTGISVICCRWKWQWTNTTMLEWPSVHVLNRSGHYQLYKLYHDLVWCFNSLVAQMTQMTFSECGCCFQCISAVFWLFYSLLVRHQSPELRPMPPHYLNVSPENLFTAMGIMSIITNSSVRLQTGWSFLQSFIEGSCFQVLMLPQSIQLLSKMVTTFCSTPLFCTGDLLIT